MQVRILSPALHDSLPHLFGISKALVVCCTDRGNGALPIIKLAVVVPELEFAQVAVQVLFRNTVVNAVKPAPQHPEEALNRVRMHVAPDVFIRAMAHGFMAARVLFANAAIARPFIGQYAGGLVHILANGAFKSIARYVRDDPWTYPTAPLKHPHNRNLPGLDRLSAARWMARLSADKYLVHFHVALEWFNILFVHREADAMEHEQGRLVGQSGLSVNFQGANPFR